MERLYVAVQGSTLGRTGERVQIRKAGIVLKDVRARGLEEVLIFGKAQLTADAVAYFLEREIPVIFLTCGGRYRGRLLGKSTRMVTLRQAQYAAVNDAVTRLAVARRLLGQKVRFQHYLLARANRLGDIQIASEAMALRLLQERIEGGEGDSADDLMGLEGAAAATYYGAYARTLKQDLGFHCRRRRPPKDPVNALLSFGYTLLQGTLSACIDRTGLDSYLGVLHSDKDRRESLVLDLMEPFRPLVVDVAVRQVVNRRSMSSKDFIRSSDGGVYLGSKGIPILVNRYQSRLEQTVIHQQRKEKIELGRLIELYVRALVKGLREGNAADLGPVPVNW